MAKKRGLPDGFALSVKQAAPVGDEKPVKLGDYLEEEDVASVVEKQAKTHPLEKAIEADETVKPQPVAEPAPEPIKEESITEQPVEPAPVVKQVDPYESIPTPPPAPPKRPSRRKSSPPRKQVNMTPETIERVNDIMDKMVEYGPQSDLKASELFEALVLALYEAKEQLDLSNVRPRGQWGSPTARAFPVAIKNSIQRAIARHMGE